MKQIKMIGQFYQNNLFSSVLLIFILTITLYFFTLAAGQFRYIQYAHSQFLNAGLENAVYFMPNIGIRSAGEKNSMDMVSDLIRKVSQYPGVQSIINLSTITINYGDEGDQDAYTIFLCDDALLGAFFRDLSLNQLPSIHTDQSGQIILQVVVGGPVLSQNKQGNIFNVSTRGSQQLTLKVVENLGSICYVPYFSSANSVMVSDDFLLQTDAILIKQDMAMNDLISRLNLTVNPAPNFFVLFNKEAPELEKSACLNFLQQNGSCLDYGQILAASNEYIRKSRKEDLPIPFFFLFVSMTSFISVSFLFIQKKLNEHAIYFLCGCSRRRSVCYLSFGIGLISLIPFLVNIWIIANYRLLPMITSKIILGRFAIAGLLIYLALILVFAVLSPYWLIQKLSPVEIYREMGMST